MAFTVINTTDTLEQMRVKLNTLTQTDFGNDFVIYLVEKGHLMHNVEMKLFFTILPAFRKVFS